MGRDIRFLAGIHRSGNTVLASILNQNPDFYIEGISPLVGLMWETDVFKSSDEISIINNHQKHTEDFISKIPETFYSYVKEPIIIDRCKAWITPGNFRIIRQYITDTPKIIFTTRPLVEVISSLIVMNKEHYVSTIPYNWNYKTYMSENDNIAEHLLHSSSPMDTFLLSYNTLSNSDNKDYIHVVKYCDLLSNPEKTLEDIYKFFDLDLFKHDFNNIKSEDVYNDSIMGFSTDLHKIRKTISKSNLNPEDVLSDKMIDRINAMDPYYILGL